MVLAASSGSMHERTGTAASPPRRASRRAGRRVAKLLVVGLCCTACGEDPRSELLEIAATSDPGERSREITACIYDSLLEHHGSEVASRLVEMTRANARREALPPDAGAVLALSLQEAARCAERPRREQSAADAPSRETRLRRGAHS